MRRKGGVYGNSLLFRKLDMQKMQHALSMSSYSVHFKFSQHFDFPAKKAFEWSTDYHKDDIARQGKKGTRKIQRKNEDTLVLTDILLLGDKKKRDVKRRLVRIFPERLMMVNTRLSAANRYSQFIYEFVPEGENASRLDFTGSQIYPGKKPSPAQLAELAQQLADEDSNAWKHLAEAMKKDLQQR